MKSIVCLLVAFSCFAGCRSGEALRTRRAEQERAAVPEIRALRVDLHKLERENAKLKADNELLKGRCGDLVKRAEELARTLHANQEDHDHMRATLRALSTVPSERDRYKAELEKAREKIRLLEANSTPIK